MSKPAFSLGDLQQGAKSLNNTPEIRKKDAAKGDDEGEENIARLSKMSYNNCYFCAELSKCHVHFFVLWNE